MSSGRLQVLIISFLSGAVILYVATNPFGTRKPMVTCKIRLTRSCHREGNSLKCSVACSIKRLFYPLISIGLPKYAL